MIFLTTRFVVMEQLYCRNVYCSHNFVGEYNVISCTTGRTDHLKGQAHEALEGFALKYGEYFQL